MPDIEGSGAFEAAVAEIDRQIADLQQTRERLVRLSGRQLPDAPLAATNGSVRPTIPVAGDAVAAVREQEFSGMSVAKAAAAFLRKIGRHEKTTTIIAAIRKGGVEVGGKYPESSVYTTLTRRPGFVSLGKNYWDLAERRPDLAGERRAKPAKGGPKKARRRKEAKTPKAEKEPPKKAPRVVRIAPEAPAAATA